MRAVVILIGLLAAVARAGETPEPAPTPVERRPDILLLLLDTLRADEIGPYGAAVTRTPALDRFAREATTFERAYAPSSYTRTSIASLFTGVAPEVHGVDSHRHWLSGASASLVRLATLLRDAGYYTVGLVANPNVDATFGYGVGFDRYVGLYPERSGPTPPRHSEMVSDASVVVDRIRKEIAAAPADRPLFLFALPIDPHVPYTPPPPWDGRYDARAAGGAAGTLRSVVAIDQQIRAGRTPNMELARALYRGEISYADRHFGELVEWLRAEGRLDRTLVAFSSDHGEEFLDHGDRGHFKTVYEESVRVPLIVRHPASFAAGARVDTPVDLLDLAATVVRTAGAELPPYWSGRDLRSRALEPRPIFVSIRHVGRFRGVIDGEAKLVVNDRTRAVELYDLATDPRERTPRRDEGATARRGELLHLLQAHAADSDALRRRMIDGDLTLETVPDDLRQRLESIGYVH